jgi:hypothetical protein
MKCPCGSEDVELRRREAITHFVMEMHLCRNCGRYSFDERDLQEAPAPACAHVRAYDGKVSE